ncbi:hypothetical protein IPA_02160 [Ignicoccus pacificus DSM 13166]|uniref:Polymerase beta nucleotidyltransferase domain-containing protein n=1 Tax=Ignicoccus pacificus DSM 13166 TaxID=940294 RepID=A0A977K951_9CREN|nr:hypothetical protein IPA_02160 [Ignicoccus pacificus DSM 13166]
MSKLEALLKRIEEYYEEFVQAKREWEEGKERIYAVERLAQLLAQSLLDFSAILASRLPGRKPESYKELAEFLASKIGHKEFLVGLAGFRNVLVHMYIELDEELERESFDEIEEEMPKILKALRELAKGDPCLSEVKREIAELASKWNLRYVALIGSLAREGCGNDVDLVVKFGRMPKGLELGRFVAEAEDALGSKVDVIVVDLKLDPIMAKTIVDEGVLIFGSEEEFEEDKLVLYKKFLDEKRLVLNP